MQYGGYIYKNESFRFNDKPVRQQQRLNFLSLKNALIGGYTVLN